MTLRCVAADDEPNLGERLLQGLRNEAQRFAEDNCQGPVCVIMGRGDAQALKGVLRATSEVLEIPPGLLPVPGSAVDLGETTLVASLYLAGVQVWVYEVLS